QNLSLWQRQLIRQRGAFPHPHNVLAVALSREGRTAATASEDGTARLWDVATGKPIGEPLVHSHPVLVLAFSPDGKKLLTGTLGGEGQEKGMKGAVRLWEADTGKAVGESLDHRAAVRAVAFSPDGGKFLTVSIREAQLWDT